MGKGLVHIYCGDGKGKTTSAIGLSLRAAGADYIIYFVQFLKSSDTSELSMLRNIDNLRVIRGNIPHGFSWELSEIEKKETKDEHNRIFKDAIKLCKEGEKTLLVLDEIIGAYSRDLIERELLIDFLKNKPGHLEIVMTGRNPDELLIDLADYVSEIVKIKHPIDKGITARIGIEK